MMQHTLVELVITKVNETSTSCGEIVVGGNTFRWADGKNQSLASSSLWKMCSYGSSSTSNNIGWSQDEALLNFLI